MTQVDFEEITLTEWFETADWTIWVYQGALCFNLFMYSMMNFMFLLTAMIDF